jgi:predicted  nucleic acid-binding Zn-ribbon protein
MSTAHAWVQEKLRKIMGNVQQLLPLLTAAAAAPESTRAALAETQEQIAAVQGDTADAREQMERIRDAVATMQRLMTQQLADVSAAQAAQCRADVQVRHCIAVATPRHS